MVQESRQDATGRAVALLLFGVVGGLGLDLCAKGLLSTYSLEQFVFVRSVIGLAIFVLLGRQLGGLKSLVTSKLRWHLLRTLLATGAMFGFFYGLARMPLVDALTLGFTAPLMVTALSVPMLGEHVGWRRWVAVIVGFAGVLIILRPGAGDLSLAAIAVLFAALCYAVLAITARKLASTESSYALSVYVIAGPMLVSGILLSEGDWQAPDVTGWILFIAAGACSVIAWIGIIGGYRRASPGVAGAARPIRVYGADRRSNRRLPDLGRGAGPLGGAGCDRNYRVRIIRRIPGDWQRYLEPLFAYADGQQRGCAETAADPKNPKSWP